MSGADEVEVFLVDDQWVGGYEVCGLTNLDGRPAFHVRRQSDGDVLPEPVAATRIRPAHSAPRLSEDDGRG